MGFPCTSSDLPPRFYTLPENFATGGEMLYFATGMIVNLANEVRAMRLAIENVHSKMGVSNDKPRSDKTEDT